MILLAIDTAGPGCFAAVYDSDTDTVLGKGGDVIGRGHAEQLMAFIEDAVSQSGLTLDVVDRIAVTIGPGSFTGIRVGVAAARGLALALGVPAVGISTLAVLAETARETAQPVLAIIDPGRDEVYCQSFDASGAETSPASILSIADARALFSGFDGIVTGSGRDLLHTDANGTPRVLDNFDIAAVARLGAVADPAIARPAPVYLRGPDAKVQTGFAVSRA